jgi:UDP-N-acetyl-D-glucosamine dehydrogenase
MKVVVVGQGYVGLPIAMAASGAGHEVFGYDLNLDLIANLQSGISHIEDIDSSTLKKSLDSGNYKPVTDPRFFSECEVAIIAVPTPLNSNREPDISYIEKAAATLGTYLSKSALIINESTSYPGTLRNVIKPKVEESAPLGIEHIFAISPERVDPGNKNWGIGNTPRLISGLSESTLKKAKEFYSSFCSNLIETSSPEVAETAKLFENTFRQVNIALVNELSQITHALNINVHEVISAASTKPYGFMEFRPGLGVGGHCIPVDPTYLAFASDLVSVEAKFIRLANEVNINMPLKVVERIKEDNGENLSQKRILIVGMAYKSDISDTRESPSIRLLDLIREESNDVFWHDPLVGEFRGEKSFNDLDSKFDIIVVGILHSSMDHQKFLKSSKYVLDCTGKIKNAVQL